MRESLFVDVFLTFRQKPSGRASADTVRGVCGRFVSTHSAEEIASYFGATVEAESMPANYNVAPTNDILAIVDPGDGEFAVRAFQWGLVPLWAKDVKIGSSMINARSETISEKPAYKGVFKKYRCLIPMDGFYEWKAGQEGGRSARTASRSSSRCSSTVATASRSRSQGCGTRGAPRTARPRRRGCTRAPSSPLRRTTRCRRCTIGCR